LINYLENDDLVLENNHFGSQKDDAINLAGVQITGHLDFDGSQASWHVNMDSLRAGALTMRRARFQKVWLASAKIEVLLDASDATIPGEFRMINIQVGNDLQTYKSTLTTVLLQSARIDGTLSIEGRRDEGREHAPPQSVDLSEAKVGIPSFGSLAYGPRSTPPRIGVVEHTSFRLTLLSRLCEQVKSTIHRSPEGGYICNHPQRYQQTLPTRRVRFPGSLCHRGECLSTSSRQGSWSTAR